MKRCLAVAALCFSVGASAAPLTLTEGFDSVVPAGWSAVNNSVPVGITSWFQGNAGVFGAHAGAANSYAAANFNSAAGNGAISTWLISPQLDFASQLLSFFARTDSTPAGAPAFGDGLRVWISDSGASTDLGDFDQLLLAVNPGNQAGGFPDDWTEFTANLLAAGSGRVAFEYFHESADFANYIGLDSVNVIHRAVDEPGVLLLAALALGAAGLVRRGKVLGAALLAAAALPVGAQAPSAQAVEAGLMQFPNVRVVNRPATAKERPDRTEGAGMRAFLDPQTGALTEPTQDAVDALERAAAASARSTMGALRRRPAQFQAQQGLVGLRSEGRYLSYSVVRRTEDGGLARACVADAALASRLVDAGKVATVSGEARQ